MYRGRDLKNNLIDSAKRHKSSHEDITISSLKSFFRDKFKQSTIKSDVILNAELEVQTKLDNLHNVEFIDKVMSALFKPVRHLYSVVRHPSSVISRPLQSLPFTPISLFRAVDTDFCVPTVLNRYSPGKWSTEALCVGNSLSTAHYHDLWSASAIRRPLKSLPDRF